MPKRISLSEYEKFILEYFHYEKYSQLRCGQAFMNKYYPDLGGYTHIYYAENGVYAAQEILKTFVKQEK